jgi:hypothetical protein
MSRTFRDKPMRLELNNDGFADPWKQEYSKCFPSTKCPTLARLDRRMIRHSPIDEENTNLINALAKYKANIPARNIYW